MMITRPADFFEAQAAKAFEEFKKTGKKISLLLHVCCAPCSSAVLERVKRCFQVTVLFYNPNIFPRIEHDRRRDEMVRLVSDCSAGQAENEGSKEKKIALKEFKGISIVELPYEPEEFYLVSAGLEEEPEGSIRCRNCFSLRLRKTALYAAENGFDFFTTTLSISPHKNSQWINAAGEMAARSVGEKSAYLYADFKKKEGYKRSLELSKLYNLYRQDYCGCEFSLRDKEKKAVAVDC